MSTSTSSNSSSSPASPSALGDSLTLPNSLSGETSPATSVPSSPDLNIKPEYDLEIEEKDDEDDNGFPVTFPSVPKSTTYSSPDEKDAGTPDAWLNRDPRLVRLTGKVSRVLPIGLQYVFFFPCSSLCRMLTMARMVSSFLAPFQL
jgi:nitrate reductase (NAD(P)H)